MSLRARVCTSVRCESTRALCFGVRLYGTSPKKDFVRCEPTSALDSVLVLADQVFVLLYTSVRREPKTGFVRCDPTRALCSVLVLAHQGFVPSDYVLVRARVQISEPVPLYGARAHKGFVLLCTSVRCEPKRALCGANPQGLYTVCWWSPPRALYQVLMYSCGRVCR